MRNVLKRSGAKATVSLSGRFRRTRWWLTGLYTVLLGAILMLSGTITYTAFSQRLEYRYDRFHARARVLVIETGSVPNPTEVRRDLFDALLVVNGMLLLSAAVLSYHLAGLTLRPIQAAYERQRQFLSDASHELRTPLAILQTDLENSRGTNPDAESHLEEVQRMSRLVSDLLSLSRLDEVTAMKPTFHAIDVAEVAEEAVGRLRSTAEKQGIAIRYAPAETSPLMVMADKELLLQALSNVVRNAIYYNKEQGSVTVSVEKEKSLVCIRVADTGVGISEEDQKKIFDRFYRVDKCRSRQTGGSGLGLSIVQSIMTHLGGSVSLKSARGEGTIMTLSLPIHKAS